MGMSASIDQAVCMELASENRPQPVTYQETMGITYHYNLDTIQDFLNAVAERLKQDSPSYAFDAGALNPGSCVAARVVDLEAMIAQHTKPV